MISALKERFAGRVERDNGDTVYTYVVYRLADLKAAYGELGEDWEESLPIDLGWSAYDGGPGRWFWHAPNVRIVGKNVIVTQRGGYDV